jgi:hypothetical protein
MIVLPLAIPAWLEKPATRQPTPVIKQPVPIFRIRELAVPIRTASGLEKARAVPVRIFHLQRTVLTE